MKKSVKGALTILVTVIIVGALALSFTACDDDEKSGGKGSGGWTAEYAVGDTGPGGGKIFYVADGKEGRPLGFTVQGYGNPGDPGYFATYTAHYLEAAPANANKGSTVKWEDWGTSVAGITTFISTSDAKANEIGNGRRDTQLIVAHMEGKSIMKTAAQVCNEYSNNGKSDWFLPSLEELYLYYQSTVTEQKPGTNQRLWSSSQYDNNQSWYIYFNGGFRGQSSKNDNNYVRAIRAF